MKKIPRKTESVEYVLGQIKESTVFGKKKNVIPQKRKKDPPYRSDADKPRIPSSNSKLYNTYAKREDKYSGNMELSIGLGYNKGGLQVLLKKEIKDAGKKTSQLED